MIKKSPFSAGVGFPDFCGFLAGDKKRDDFFFSVIQECKRLYMPTEAEGNLTVSFSLPRLSDASRESSDFFFCFAR